MWLLDHYALKILTLHSGSLNLATYIGIKHQLRQECTLVIKPERVSTPSSILDKSHVYHKKANIESHEKYWKTQLWLQKSLEIWELCRFYCSMHLIIKSDILE